MNIIVLTTLCAVLFGAYDLAIKLASGNGNPTMGAMLVQLSSTITLAILAFTQPLSEPLKYSTNLIYAVIAGILIAFALSLLFSILKNPSSQASMTIPFTLIGRNLVLVTLSVIILREPMSVSRLLGLMLGLTSMFLINR